MFRVRVQGFGFKDSEVESVSFEMNTVIDVTQNPDRNSEPLEL